MFRPILALGRTLSAKGLIRDNTGAFEVSLVARFSDSLPEDRLVQDKQ
jgi:hypothetical protein